MKRIFKGHINFGSMNARRDDEFYGHLSENLEVRPEALRWFCGMHDLASTYICQAL